MNSKIKRHNPLLAIVTLFISISLVGCGNDEKEEKLLNEQNKIAIEEEEKISLLNYIHQLELQHNSISLDSLFSNDSSQLTYSYSIQRKLIKTGKPILARAVILDITQVADTTFSIKSALTYNKKNEEGLLYAELSCSKNVLEKIENLGLPGTDIDYVYLVINFEGYTSSNYEYKEFTDYIKRSVKGNCIDIEYDNRFNRQLKFNPY